LLAYPLGVVAEAIERGVIDAGHVVIPAGDDASLGLVREMKLEAIQNRAPERGLSYSLQLGLDAVQGTDAAAALILLGDQPLVRLDVVEALISTWYTGAGAMIRPRYGERPSVPGHPVVVGRSMWSQIQQLKGDTGFASLGAGSAQTVVDVAGQNPDVDTLGDLRDLEVLQQ
jgi:CTP:molybdopterin cytidylyltransferase MocA